MLACRRSEFWRNAGPGKGPLGMWFTETPWPPIFLCALAFVGCLIGWKSQQRPGYLTGMIASVFAALLVWIVERSIVTERERVEAAVHNLAWAVQNESALYDLGSAFPGEDHLKTLSFISRHAPALRELAWRGLQFVRVAGDLRITDVNVTLRANGTRARSHFRANGTFVLPDGSTSYEPTRWLLTWQLEDGQWRVIRIQRLNVITGQPYRNIFALH